MASRDEAAVQEAIERFSKSRSEWSTASSSTSGCRRPRPPTCRPSSGATGTGCARAASWCRATERRDHLWASREVREDPHQQRAPRAAPDRLDADLRRELAPPTGTGLISHEFFAAASAAPGPARWSTALATPRCTSSSPRASRSGCSPPAGRRASRTARPPRWPTTAARVSTSRRRSGTGARSTSGWCSSAGRRRCRPSGSTCWCSTRRRPGTTSGTGSPGCSGSTRRHRPVPVVPEHLDGRRRGRDAAPRSTARLEGFDRAFDKGVYIRTFLADERLVPRAGEQFWPEPDQVEDCRRRGDAAVDVPAGRPLRRRPGDVEHLLGPRRARAAPAARRRSPTPRWPTSRSTSSPPCSATYGGCAARPAEPPGARAGWRSRLRRLVAPRGLTRQSARGHPAQPPDAAPRRSGVVVAGPRARRRRRTAASGPRRSSATRSASASRGARRERSRGRCPPRSGSMLLEQPQLAEQLDVVAGGELVDAAQVLLARPSSGRSFATSVSQRPGHGARTAR